MKLVWGKQDLDQPNLTLDKFNSAGESHQDTEFKKIRLPIKP